MRIVLFCHTVTSCWDNGSAHFLRGVVSELLTRGHRVHVYEPYDASSVKNLLRHHGLEPIEEFTRRYPDLKPIRYVPEEIDVGAAVDGADLVIVHERNDPKLVAALGQHRRDHAGYRLLFHDTHHRAVSAPQEMENYDLTHYDGVLAFGAVLRQIYLEKSWTERAWTWHEAADVRVFRPRVRRKKRADLVDAVITTSWPNPKENKP